MIRNVKIVVVENNEMLRRLMVDVLMFCINREVLAFDSANAAWDHICRSGDVDMVFSDVDMDGMNGLELLARVKEARPKTVFVVVSGRASHEEAAQQLGADAFVGKPFSIHDLFRIVETFVVGDD